MFVKRCRQIAGYGLALLIVMSVSAYNQLKVYQTAVENSGRMVRIQTERLAQRDKQSVVTDQIKNALQRDTYAYNQHALFYNEKRKTGLRRWIGDALGFSSEKGPLS